METVLKWENVQRDSEDLKQMGRDRKLNPGKIYKQYDFKEAKLSFNHRGCEEMLIVTLEKF